MKRIGTISYNIYCNFTNYGSALQTWALHQAMKKLSNGRWEPVLVDYCPDILKDKNPLNPFANMWDQDEESRKMCELSMPAIQENYYKFDEFYHNQFERTEKKYTAQNFNEVVNDEQLDGFVCGSDTIFCIDEFGFDDGYYANYPCMKNGYTVSYAASFGDSHFNDESYSILNDRLNNFKAIALREYSMVDYVRQHVNVPVEKVIDPTLLLYSEDYEKITAPRMEKEKYLLLYARRHNENMSQFAEHLATQNGWKIIEISLRATNKNKHRMFYEAGVEEFLSLVKNAECIITNSFHGVIFSIQFRKSFYAFTREQCNIKIDELLEMAGIKERMLVIGKEASEDIDYEKVHERIRLEREKSLRFLEQELEGCK